MLTVTGAARRLGVHVNTVRAWTDQGRLSCLRINSRGDRRYRVEEIERFLDGADREAADARSAADDRRRAVRARRETAESRRDERPQTASGAGASATRARPSRVRSGRAPDAFDVVVRVADAATRTDDVSELVRVAENALARLGRCRLVVCRATPSAIETLAGRAEPDVELIGRATGRGRVVRSAGGGRSGPSALAVAVEHGPDMRVVLQLSLPPRASERQPVERLLLGLAALFGAALRAGRERAQLEEQARRAELVLAAGGEINSQLDLPRSLRELAENARELFGADHSAIFRHLPDGHFKADVAVNLAGSVVEAVETAASLPLVRQAFRSGTIVSAVDYPSDPRSTDTRDALLAQGINTVTIAPLISEGERLGVLALLHDRRYEWSDDALATLELLARQGAVAVRNARNYGQMATWAAQLQSIQQLGSRLTRLSSVREIGQAIAAELHQLIDYHNVRVYRVFGEEVLPVAWRGQVGEYVGEDGDQLRVRVGEGITGWVARYGLAQNLSDAAKDRRTQTIPGTEDDLDESLLLAPMLYDDQVIGVIVLAKLGLNQFTSDDLRLLEIYASIAAQAMANADTTERLRAQSATLERQLQSQRELLRVTESILGTLDTPALLEEVADSLGTLLHVDNIGVDVHDQSAGVLRPIFARGVHAAAYLSRALPDHAGVAGVVVRTGEAALVQDELADSRVAHFDELGPQPGALIVAPLRSREGIAGVLTIERLGIDARFSEEEFELVKLFAGHASIALGNAARHQAVELRAQTDALTGLHNQGALPTHLERAVARDEPFALLMIDLDDFKLFNDRRGHPAGNVMLARLAAVLRAACRETDVVFRYGGDEFAILLPTTSAAGAVEVASKVREAIRSVTDGRQPPLVVTASIGVAAFPADGPDATAVLLAADRACYAAKRRGRDRIATAVEGLALADELLPAPTPVDEPDAAYSAA
jgi:diguanylate cyclase (GGDEF)-like protein/excisionase family DNA binding protein